MQVETSPSSIFGGREKKDESQSLAAAERRGRGAMMEFESLGVWGSEFGNDDGACDAGEFGEGGSGG